MVTTPRKRTPAGGRHVTVWLNTRLQATLEQYASEHKLSLSQAATAILKGWAERQPR